MSEHALGWQDEQLAELTWCGKTLVPSGTILNTDEWRECPVCGEQLKLRWNVEPVAANAAPTDTELLDTAEREGFAFTNAELAVLVESAALSWPSSHRMFHGLMESATRLRNADSTNCSQCGSGLDRAESYAVVCNERWCLRCFTTGPQEQP